MFTVGVGNLKSAERTASVMSTREPTVQRAGYGKIQGSCVVRIFFAVPSPKI